MNLTTLTLIWSGDQFIVAKNDCSHIFQLSVDYIHFSFRYGQTVKHTHLSKTYLNKGFWSWIMAKIFFCLSFLPPAEVGDEIIELLSIAPFENECVHFADHVLNTYIDENSEFPFICGHQHQYLTISEPQMD